MKILHLTDTPLSGSPLRISNLIDDHTEHESKCIMWEPRIEWRYYGQDIEGQGLKQGAIWHWLEWADVIHYHNRWRRQKIFKAAGVGPPRKPSVIQMHNPRESDRWGDELDSGLPIAVLAQYHSRQWPEARFIVPNVIDITNDIYDTTGKEETIGLPTVSFAPSNTNCRGWDDKGYGSIGRMLKKMKLSSQIYYQLLIKMDLRTVLILKRLADIGIDDVVTGSYHLSSLEYLAMGVPCIAHIDAKTQDVLKSVTGATSLPWYQATNFTFEHRMHEMLKSGSWRRDPTDSPERRWMETYWNPLALCDYYIKMYEAL